MAHISVAEWKLLGGAALVVVIATLASRGAQAATTCERWDVSGSWSIVQDNGVNADIVVAQGDTIILGNAKTPAYFGGNLDGTLVGSEIKLNIYWNTVTNEDGYHGKNVIGNYVGTIAPTARITGTTSAEGNPQNHARWYSSRAMGCAHWTTSPAPKPGVALGRVKPPAGSQPSPQMTICQRAEDAALRDSPAYPELRRQCLAQNGR